MSRTELLNVIGLTQLSFRVLTLLMLLLIPCFALILIGLSVAGWIFELDLRPFVPLSALIWALCLVGFVVWRMMRSDLKHAREHNNKQPAHLG